MSNAPTQGAALSRTRLWRWRVEQGWTLSDLAGLTGLSEAFLSRAERGQRRLAPATKVRFARAVGVEVSDLFEPELNVDQPGQDGEASL